MSRVIADGLSDKALALISSSIDADTLDGIDSLGFDAAGDADTAVSDHVALADPHAQYAEITGGANSNFTAMPQVGGDPIVESGSNADGEWTRWADGTQAVNTLAVSVTPIAQDWSGTLFRTAATVTFPVTFIGAPNSLASLERTGIASTLCTSRSTTTSGSVITVIGNTSDAVGISATAIGRWK